MAKYRVNLISKNEKITKLWRKIIFVLSILVVVLMVLDNYNASTPKRRLGIEGTLVSDSLATELNEKKAADEDEAAEESIENEENSNQKDKEKTESAQALEKKFLDELDGYKISGIEIKEKSDSQVSLTQKKETKKYKVGDKLGKYTIQKIHRTYIILESENEKIHLNYVD